MKDTKTIFSVILLLLFSMCRKEIDMGFIKSNQWIYQEGFRIGEGSYINFKKSTLFKINHDTIVYKGVSRAVVIKLNKNANEMVVLSMDGSEEGTYTNTDEFRK